MRKLYFISFPKLRRLYRRRRERINDAMTMLVMLPVAVLVWILMFL